MQLIGNWGFYVQGNENIQTRDELGLKLHLAINCDVHYPAYNLPIYECRHGMHFPKFAVESYTPEQLAEAHRLWIYG